MENGSICPEMKSVSAVAAAAATVAIAAAVHRR